eukprot:jgi/Botrbrau1/6842/Bobra.152_2s0005.2
MKFRIDAHAPQGQELQNLVKEKLREYLGSDYNDDVLPLYIVVMLQHGNNEALITENLQAFLGDAHSGAFSSWLFKLLDKEGHRFHIPEEGESQEPQEEVSEAPQARAKEAAASRGSVKEKTRDKIEWKAEKVPAPSGKEVEENGKSDRERKRERDRNKETAGLEHHHRDREGREKRRREPRESREADDRDVKRYEERERRTEREREHWDHERGRGNEWARARDPAYGREHEWDRARETERDSHRSRRPTSVGDVPVGRLSERDNPQPQRRGSPGRMEKHRQPKLEAPTDLQDVDPNVRDSTRRAEVDKPQRAISKKRGIPEDGLRSSALAPPTNEGARASVLTRLEKRSAPSDNAGEEHKSAKRAAVQPSVFDRLDGTKAPMMKPAPISNGPSVESAAPPTGFPNKPSAPSILARVSRPVTGTTDGTHSHLNPHAAPFAPIPSTIGATPSEPSGLALQPTQAVSQSSDDAIRAELEEMRAQLKELKRQQAVALAARDTCSVVVSMLDPRITPEIVKAHFSGWRPLPLSHPPPPVPPDQNLGFVYWSGRSIESIVSWSALESTQCGGKLLVDHACTGMMGSPLVLDCSILLVIWSTCCCTVVFFLPSQARHTIPSQECCKVNVE